MCVFSFFFKEKDVCLPVFQEAFVLPAGVLPVFLSRKNGFWKNCQVFVGIGVFAEEIKLLDKMDAQCSNCSRWTGCVGNA